MVGVNLRPGESNVDLGSGQSSMAHDFSQSPQTASFRDVGRRKGMPKTVRASLPRTDAGSMKQPLERHLYTRPGQGATASHPDMEAITLSLKPVPDCLADGNHSVTYFAVDHQVIISDVGPSETCQLSKSQTGVHHEQDHKAVPVCVGSREKLMDLLFREDSGDSTFVLWQGGQLVYRIGRAATSGPVLAHVPLEEGPPAFD